MRIMNVIIEAQLCTYSIPFPNVVEYYIYFVVYWTILVPVSLSYHYGENKNYILADWLTISFICFIITYFFSLCSPLLTSLSFQIL